MDISQYYTAKKPGVMTPNTHSKKKTVKRKGVIEKYLKVQPSLAQLLDVSPEKLNESIPPPVPASEKPSEIKPEIIDPPDEVMLAQLAVKHLPKRESCIGLVKPKQKKSGNQLLLGPVNPSGFKIPPALSAEDYINRFRPYFDDESVSKVFPKSYALSIPIRSRKKIFKQGEMEAPNQRKLLRRSSSFTMDPSSKKRKSEAPDISDVASTLLMLESNNGASEMLQVKAEPTTEPVINEQKRCREHDTDRIDSPKKQCVPAPSDDDNEETLSDSDTESLEDMETG